MNSAGTILSPVAPITRPLILIYIILPTKAECSIFLVATTEGVQTLCIPMMAEIGGLTEGN